MEAGVCRELPAGILRNRRERKRAAGKPRCTLCQGWATGDGKRLSKKSLKKSGL
jgi:hypothetical protein